MMVEIVELYHELHFWSQFYERTKNSVHIFLQNFLFVSIAVKCAATTCWFVEVHSRFPGYLQGQIILVT